jgi:hypothetical protein
VGSGGLPYARASEAGAESAATGDPAQPAPEMDSVYQAAQAPTRKASRRGS